MKGRYAKPDTTEVVVANGDGNIILNPISTNADIMSHLTELVDEGQYLFFTSVCRGWRHAWGHRSTQTKAVTAETSVPRLIRSFEYGLGRTSTICDAIAKIGRLDLLQCARAHSLVPLGREHLRFGCSWRALERDSLGQKQRVPLERSSMRPRGVSGGRGSAWKGEGRRLRMGRINLRSSRALRSLEHPSVGKERGVPVGCRNVRHGGKAGALERSSVGAGARLPLG